MAELDNAAGRGKNAAELATGVGGGVLQAEEGLFENATG